MLFSPGTILGWYRKLIAKKYDGSAYTHKKVGRPDTYIRTVRWVLKLKTNNTLWGNQKICDRLNNLGFDIPEQQ
jgi:hypothetical protein